MKLYHAVLALLLVSVVPVSSAQFTEAAYELHMEPHLPESHVIEPDTAVIIPLTVRDLSVDSPRGATDGALPGDTFQHVIKFKILHYNERTTGWSVTQPKTEFTFAGDEIESRVMLSVKGRVVDVPTIHFGVEATMTGPAGEITRVVNMTFSTYGQNTFGVQPGAPVQIKPGQIVHLPVKITNGALLPRGFDVEVAQNKCGLEVANSRNNLIPAKTSKEVLISVEAPRDAPYYSSKDCSLGLEVIPSDNAFQARPILYAIQIQGAYIDPTWIFWSVAIILVGAAVFMLIARRKARIEEEILGKPQKPWHIPVEKVYLDHLKERDPQAHYVVRHFLMEEEYASAMAWYKEFKHATKGSRAKERLVVVQEHKLQRFRDRWGKKIARPVKKADKVALRLQRKLDRRGRKGLRVQRKKWKKLTKKMRKAHEAKVSKATEKWQKKATKAEKKKRPVPEKPVFAEPDYPAEPTGDKLLLKDHKWQKKADKAMAKAVKKQGNLEVRFEKKEAKVLGKVRRRVLKIAKKLDDPEFEESHPLLNRAET